MSVEDAIKKAKERAEYLLRLAQKNANTPQPEPQGRRSGSRKNPLGN